MNKASRRNKSGAPLSPRETEVLTLLAKGYSNAEIADILNGNPFTIGDNVKNIFAKLEVDSRAEAGARACELGLHGVHAAKMDPLPEAMVARILAECDHEPGTHIDAAMLMKFANRLAAEVRGALPAAETAA